jgi:FlaA1/EpsC-like NDP-sugar epimerase
MRSALQRTLEISRIHKQVLQAVLDLVLGALCLSVAFALQPVAKAEIAPIDLLVLVFLVPAVAVAVFYRAGLYRAILRYITGASLRAIAPGVALSTVALGLGLAVLSSQVSLAVLLHFALLFFFSIGGSRLLLRWVLRFPNRHLRQPALIYGAGQSGQQLAAALNLASGYIPVAFVDDDTHLHRATINGLPVHPSTELRALIDKWAVREVLMAMPTIPRARQRKIVAQLEGMGVEVKTLPRMSDVMRGNARFTDLLPITPEDLLGRDPVAPSPALMRKTIAGKVVLVTGAGGSIGSELCRQIVEQGPKKLILLDISEFALYAIHTELRDQFAARSDAPEILPVLVSVQNDGQIKSILNRHSVQTVFHAAAYKHVSMVEDNIVEGIQNNVFGTRVMAKAAVEAHVERFILISTDKTVRPTSVMGASKRLAELICQAHARLQSRTIFSIVRFGNVLGSSGSVIPRFRDQIERGGPVTVTHPDVVRYFMSIREAAQLVIQAGAMSNGGDVFLLDMGKPVKILELAQSMIRMHGFTPYVVDDIGRPVSDGGDIAIKITGLQKGEKLREELLIGLTSRPTDHPRIRAASEVSLDAPALAALLDDLLEACRALDLRAIRALLSAAPLDYTPPHSLSQTSPEAKVIDLVWDRDTTDIAQTDPVFQPEIENLPVYATGKARPASVV